MLYRIFSFKRKYTQKIIENKIEFDTAIPLYREEDEGTHIRMFHGVTEEIGEDLTYSEVMRDVRKIRAVEVKIGDKKVITRTNLKGKADLAFRAIGDVISPKIIGIERIE